MIITKQSVHPDLRSTYHAGKFFTWFFARRWGVKFFNVLVRLLKGKSINTLDCDQLFIPSRNHGPDIRIRLFRPKDVMEPLPAMLYIHGGGYISMVPEVALDIIAEYIKLRPCVVIAPDYRKAISHPFPAGFDDCYDALLWMRDNANELGIKADNYIVAGASAGGGLTAAVTLKARDTKDVKIAFQIPLYPMLDHRQITESSKINGAPVWNSKTNAFAWRLYLNNMRGEIPIYASPALNSNYEKLPPTITFIGDLDPFRDETLDYLNNLKEANIPVKFELFDRAFHAFDILSSKSKPAQRAIQFHRKAFVEFFDQYV